MKKVRILLFVIILLSISITWVSIKYRGVSRKYQAQQNQAKMAFQRSLGIAMSGFAVDFDSLPDENLRQQYYNKALSGLALSSQLVEFTTYNDKNDMLDISLMNLYMIMEQNEYNDSITKKSKLIYDNLSRLWQNPLDKEATDIIGKLAEEIRREK